MPYVVARKCLAGFSVLAAAAIAGVASGCSPDQPLPDERLASVRAAPCDDVTYQGFAAEFFVRYCLPCHNAHLEGDLARLDAPTGINFNTLSDVRAFQGRIRLRAGVQGDMPPRWLPLPRPTDEERLLLIRWIDCGTPQ